MQKALASASAFLQRNKSLAGFVKFALQVKYACGREGIYFISLSAPAENIPGTSALLSPKLFPGVQIYLSKTQIHLFRTP